jgi:hypothetical protein
MDDDIRERSSLLAAFARAPEKTSSTALVTMAPASLVERVVGAQQVAVHRDEQKILEKIKVLASAAGSDWYYRFPVKTKGGGQDWIEGQSIKLANDIARLYGNCEVDTRVTDLGDSWLIYARFTDYETGFTMTRPFQQRKGQRGMRTENDRALDINLQIGASKAIRNVIVNSLQSVADFALEEARNALIEKVGKQLENYRKRTTERLKQMQIDMQRVEHVVGRSVAKWTAPDVAKVIAMIQSINDGMTTADDTFPSANPANAPETTTESPAQEGRGGEDAVVSPTAEPAVTRSADQASGTAAPVENATLEALRLSAAYESGRQSKANGHARKAIPGDYREKGREDELNAWYAGFDGLPLE